jgi:hypothetical protein
MRASVAVAELGREPAEGELRVTERILCDVPASCQPPSDWKRGGQKWMARVRDISTAGLCVVVSRRFERGAGLAIEIPGSNPASPSILLARVMHVRAEPGGAWALGCSFISPLSDEELETLAQSVAGRAPPTNNRRAGAEPLTDVHFLGAVPGGGVVSRFIRKFVPNRSWPLAAGRTVTLRFREASGPLTAKVRVDACRRTDGRWVLEATFVGATPPQLLR